MVGMQLKKGGREQGRRRGTFKQARVVDKQRTGDGRRQGCRKEMRGARTWPEKEKIGGGRNWAVGGNSCSQIIFSSARCLEPGTEDFSIT